MALLLWLYSLVLGSFGLIGTVFWIWMLYDCLKNGAANRGGYIWIWILLFFNIIGAGLYFFVVWLPNHPGAFSGVSWVKQGKLHDALWQAEADARNIGHQYQRLGDIHYQMGNLEAAEQAYLTALEKEPKNVRILWGIAGVERDRKNFVTARQHLQTLISIEPEFSYGDASFEYGSVLYQMEDFDAAQNHLQKHIKSWSHPPAYLMLAEMQKQQGNSALARETLETMIIKIKGSTPFQYRKNQKFVRQAEKMLERFKK